MGDPFSPERKTGRLKKQNLFGSGYAGLGTRKKKNVPRNHGNSHFLGSNGNDLGRLSNCKPLRE
jgi:hypothetical protein